MQTDNFPRKGRFLLKYWPMRFQSRSKRFNHFGEWVRTKHPKWEEVIYVPANRALGRPQPYYMPWTGDYHSQTSQHIEIHDAIGWLPLPE